ARLREYGQWGSARAFLQGHLDGPVGRERPLGRLADGRRGIAVPGRGGAGRDEAAVGDRGDPGLDLRVVGVDEPGPEVRRDRAAPAAAGLLRGDQPGLLADRRDALGADELGAHLVAGSRADVELV